MQKQIKREELKNLYRDTANELYGKEICSLNADELNAVIAKVVKNSIIKPKFEQALNQYSEKRIAIYFSIEFLIGRIVMDSLINCGIKEMTTEIFEQEGVDIKFFKLPISHFFGVFI